MEQNKSLFALRGFKIVGGVTHATYEIFMDNGEKDTFTFKTVKPVHPDLRNQLNGLDGFLASTHWISNPKDKVKAHGISITDYDAEMKVVLKGVMNTPARRTIAINSELIALAGDQYTWVPKLKPIVQSIADECYELIFNDKTGENLLEFPSEETGKPLIEND